MESTLFKSLSRRVPSQSNVLSLRLLGPAPVLRLPEQHFQSYKLMRERFRGGIYFRLVN